MYVFSKLMDIASEYAMIISSAGIALMYLLILTKKIK